MPCHSEQTDADDYEFGPRYGRSTSGSSSDSPGRVSFKTFELSTYTIRPVRDYPVSEHDSSVHGVVYYFQGMRGGQFDNWEKGSPTPSTSASFYFEQRLSVIYLSPTPHLHHLSNEDTSLDNNIAFGTPSPSSSPSQLLPLTIESSVPGRQVVRFKDCAPGSPDPLFPVCSEFIRHCNKDHRTRKWIRGLQRRETRRVWRRAHCCRHVKSRRERLPQQRDAILQEKTDDALFPPYPYIRFLQKWCRLFQNWVNTSSSYLQAFESKLKCYFR